MQPGPYESSEPMMPVQQFQEGGPVGAGGTSSDLFSLYQQKMDELRSQGLQEVLPDNQSTESYQAQAQNLANQALVGFSSALFVDPSSMFREPWAPASW